MHALHALHIAHESGTCGVHRDVQGAQLPRRPARARVSHRFACFKKKGGEGLGRNSLPLAAACAQCAEARLLSCIGFLLSADTAKPARPKGTV